MTPLQHESRQDVFKNEHKKKYETSNRQGRLIQVNDNTWVEVYPEDNVAEAVAKCEELLAMKPFALRKGVLSK